MAGASEAHNLLAGNWLTLLNIHLRGEPCKVFISDMKVQIKTATAEYYYYPDILVTCNATDNRNYYKTQPLLIVEILSDSTARIDRGEKLQNYKKLDRLQEYVLVDQNRRYVEIYTRANDWQPEICTESITLKALNLSLSMAEIYERIDDVGVGVVSVVER
jgi:Uma2 family endonuclease